MGRRGKVGAVREGKEGRREISVHFTPSPNKGERTCDAYLGAGSRRMALFNKARKRGNLTALRAGAPLHVVGVCKQDKLLALGRPAVVGEEDWGAKP